MLSGSTTRFSSSNSNGKFRTIDIIRDSILQYIIREHFDDEKLFVLLLKIGILSCVRTWEGRPRHEQVTGRPNRQAFNSSLRLIMSQGAPIQNTVYYIQSIVNEYFEWVLDVDVVALETTTKQNVAASRVGHAGWFVPAGAT
jgi:hypothetical protein